jgi:Cu(I)/Ag(I) efflux system membrane fusion protein
MNRIWLLSLLLVSGCRGKVSTTEDMPGMPGMKASPSTEAGAGIQPTAGASAMMGLTVASVRAGTGQVPRRAPASVSFDPTASVRVTTQSGGQVRSLTVPAPGGSVTRGQVLARLYDPSLRAILEEVRVARTLDEPWRAAAASRARASGIGDAEIRAVQDGETVPETFPIRAPIAGVVSARPVAEGTWVAPGGVLALLVDSKAILVDLVVDGAAPAFGTAVALRDPSAGSFTIAATVVGVLPEATAAGIRVRVHALGVVTPGRPLVAEWTDVTPSSLWVPAGALVDTGTRQVVFIKTDAGFVPRPVEPGVRAGDEIEIRTGVVAGESVAGSAAFLLDSETQIGSMGHAGHAAPAETPK